MQKNQNTYDVGVKINLPPPQSMKRGTGKRVMIVVPALTENCDRHPRVIAAVIVAPVGTLSEDVTDRVDAPRRMMTECDAYQPSPKQSVQAATPASDESETQSRG
jgi:hypothetical protein